MKKILLGVLGTFPLFASSQSQPNVLLILTDDQGWGDVGANGNPLINTPTIDKLYAQSAVLNHFYVSPLSAPTRASLLTGRYHLKTGVSSVQSGQENMNPEETTIAEVLKSSGYKTGCFGKWHNGCYYPYTPNGQGFDEFLGFCCGHWSNYFNPRLQHNEEMTRGNGYISDIFADNAINFIENNQKSPFFCYLAFNAPHSPYQVPDEYFDRYKDLKNANERDRNALACIYGMVENVDFNISRVLEKLDELKLTDNTIIIFMTDNGPTGVERYNGGMRGKKGEVHEGGVRVPCYISWKGKINHRIIDFPTAHIDIMPTILSFCDINDYKTAFPIDGLNLRSLIEGKSSKLNDRNIYTHRLVKNLTPYLGGARSKDYRLCVYKDSLLLFNICNDPSENINLYSKKTKIGHKLYSDYKTWFNDASQYVKLNPLIPIGYKEAPNVRIPTPEGTMYGKLKCYGYPNQNWVNHFLSEKDSLVFELDVVNDSRFDVSIEYIQKGEDTKPLFYVECDNSRLMKKLPQFIPEQVYSPDRVERIEAKEHTWGVMSIGQINLKKGKYKLKLYADKVLSTDDVQLKTILLNIY